MFRRAAIWAVVGLVVILAAGAARSLRDARDPDVPVLATASRPVPTKPTTPTMAHATTQLSPSPTLKPEEVVRTIIEALANNDVVDEDEGIRVTWAFASPGNKQVTGPFERFAPMVKSPAYRPMLTSTSADYRPIVVVGDRAEQLVALTDAKGYKAYYLFRLSRQGAGPLRGCWMTDGVFRMQAAEKANPGAGEEPQPPPKAERLPV